MRLLQASLVVLALIVGTQNVQAREEVAQREEVAEKKVKVVEQAPAGFPAPANASQQYPFFRVPGALDPSFYKDILDVHLKYEVSPGAPYDLWFFSEHRVVYEISGGRMAPRKNYQTAAYQCIRPGELWQINWLEETGTIASVVYDIPNKKLTNLLSFSKGHDQYPVMAHGDKRNATDFARWRTLANVGNQRERSMIAAQVKIDEVTRGAGNLVPIAPDAPTW